MTDQDIDSDQDGFEDQKSKYSPTLYDSPENRTKVFTKHACKFINDAIEDAFSIAYDKESATPIYSEKIGMGTEAALGATVPIIGSGIGKACRLTIEKTGGALEQNKVTFHTFPLKINFNVSSLFRRHINQP